MTAPRTKSEIAAELLMLERTVRASAPDDHETEVRYARIALLVRELAGRLTSSRKFHRLPVPLLLSLTRNGAEAEYEATDLSLGGVRLVGDVSTLQRAVRVTVTHLRMNHIDYEVEVASRVVWSGEQAPIVGLAFGQMTPVSRSRLYDLFDHAYLEYLKQLSTDAA